MYKGKALFLAYGKENPFWLNMETNLYHFYQSGKKLYFSNSLPFVSWLALYDQTNLISEVWRIYIFFSKNCQRTEFESIIII